MYIKYFKQGQTVHRDKDISKHITEKVKKKISTKNKTFDKRITKYLF